MVKVVKSEKVGQKFTEARFKLNLSLEDISKNILINIKYLEAIEKDDYSIFPARAFALAYYKKYSKFLEIKDIFPLKESKSRASKKEESIKASSIFTDMSIEIGNATRTMFLGSDTCSSKFQTC